ncbi:MAG: DUF302 domain-containing protein [Pseudomonadota bacterium]
MLSRLLALVLFTGAVPAVASDLITKESAHDVATTIDRLEKAVANAGATVFARVDHAGGAASVGAELAPTEMLMFGNPALGTPAIQAAPTAGLDLPLRALAYEDATGTVILVYRDPAALVDAHGIPADAEVLARMTGALDRLTDAATAP